MVGLKIGSGVSSAPLDPESPLTPQVGGTEAADFHGGNRKTIREEEWRGSHDTAKVT